MIDTLRSSKPSRAVPELPASVGVVVIGRNEGERLKRCLESLVGKADRIVYVDSGSSDGSQQLAADLGVQVVELDLSRPFSMARGRNEGARHLARLDPEIEFVQFVDGDCEILDGWLSLAVRELHRRPGAAVVFGRRRERNRDDTIFNRLCDMTWGSPVGRARACGGDSMMRLSVFQEVGGFRPDMIAGEEAELCVRIRQRGRTIWALDADMTLHDIAMTRFAQWWKRTVRTGHAYAHGAALHGARPEHHNVRPLLSALAWGLAVPAAIAIAVVVGILGNPWGWGVAAVLLLGYGLLGLRVLQHRRRMGNTLQDALLYAGFCVLGKVAEAVGIVHYHVNRLLRREARLIEYKGQDCGPVGT